MPVITEAAVKKFWAVGVVVASLVAGGAIWATKVWASIERIDERLGRQESAMGDTAHEVRLLREALIRAGTALPEPK